VIQFHHQTNLQGLCFVIFGTFLNIRQLVAEEPAFARTVPKIPILLEYLYMYVCMYVYIYIYVYLYIYIPPPRVVYLQVEYYVLFLELGHLNHFTYAEHELVC